MWKPIVALALAVPCFSQTSPVKGVGNFIHAVGNLDDSVHFYRDLIGMEVPRPPGDWQTTDGVLKMYRAVGGKFRVANAQVAGVAMRIEMVEFQGVDRRPVRRAPGEPGASLLILTVDDMQSVLDRLMAANWPLSVKVSSGCNGTGFAVADPDGFPVLVIRRDAKAAPAPSGRNVIGLEFGYTVSSDALVNGAFKALGLAAAPSSSSCRRIEETLVNSGAPTVVPLPDGFRINLFPSTAGKRSAGTLLPHDPGAAVLRLATTDAEAAVRALSQAGIKVVSEGGAIQTLPPAGLKATILGAPDNLFIQVVQ